MCARYWAAASDQVRAMPFSAMEAFSSLSRVLLAAVQVDGLVRDLHDRDIDLEKQNDKLQIIERDIESAEADRETLTEELKRK